ncbi:hypothetical protein DL771_008859 [Monosporascus sp. 5C6A]|nr:hypothetical protein DL771_008859 [Monosporascus sp. 5C6A]
MDPNLSQVLMEAISQGFESVARLEENEIKTRQHYKKALVMIELVQQVKEKFATIDLETAEQLQHLARQNERKEEVMKEAQDALGAMDGDVFHYLSTMLQDNFAAQQQVSQQPTPSAAPLRKEDQHPTTSQGTKRAATENSPGEAPATHDTRSTGDIDAEIPSRVSHPARRLRTASPIFNEFNSFHASPERPNMSPVEPAEASSEIMQTQSQNPGELGDTPSSSARTRGSGRPRKSYNVESFYRELGI